MLFCGFLALFEVLSLQRFVNFGVSGTKEKAVPHVGVRVRRTAEETVHSDVSALTCPRL